MKGNKNYLKFDTMNKRQAKIDALEIASIVIDELVGSDCTENAKVKKELNVISFTLSNRSYRLKHKQRERKVVCDLLKGEYCSLCNTDTCKNHANFNG